jgi:hemoglobin
VTSESAAPSLFSRVGGQPFFDRLVAVFYEGIATDQVLAPLYPDVPDFEPAKRRLSLFLAQYWGGPTTYQEERGHPRLRMRHFPFHVGPLERDRWLLHMAAAVEQTCAEFPDGAAIAEQLMGYFVPAAEHLRNDTGLPITSAGYGTS